MPDQFDDARLGEISIAPETSALDGVRTRWATGGVAGGAIGMAALQTSVENVISWGWPDAAPIAGDVFTIGAFAVGAVVAAVGAWMAWRKGG